MVVPCNTGASAQALCRAICKCFRDVGVPLHLRSDGGTQFTSTEFRDCMARWGVDHTVSTPRYPQSYGLAEAVAEAVKQLIVEIAPNGNIDVEGFDRGLLNLRNNPNYTGRSPAQILFGQSHRSCVPAHSKSFLPKWQTIYEDCDRRAAARDNAAQQEPDQHASAPPHLCVGQRVLIQDATTRRWDKVGIIMGIGRTHDYNVRLPSGRVWWRSRRSLHPVPPPIDATHPKRSPQPSRPRAPLPGQGHARPGTFRAPAPPRDATGPWPPLMLS